jgi:hypothetical protein
LDDTPSYRGAPAYAGMGHLDCLSSISDDDCAGLRFATRHQDRLPLPRPNGNGVP